MSKQYFGAFPKVIFKKPNTDVEFPGGQQITYDLSVVDISIRYKIREQFLNNANLFYPYRWRDSDRPDTLANRYYGDSRYWWVVFYSNGSFDLNMDFPMDENNLFRFITDKYIGDYLDAQGLSIDGFKMTVPTELERRKLIYQYLGQTTRHLEIDDGIIVDHKTFNEYNGPKREVSFLEFETRLNEGKRDVQLLDDEYLFQIVKEFNTELKAIESERRRLGE